MSQDWYMAWAADHCHKFGIRDQDAKMVLAWREVFELLFTPDELRAATLHLLGSADAPRFAADHRGAVVRAVEAVRRRAAAKAVVSTAPTGCDQCGGGGIVIVPHPGLTDDGRLYPALRPPADDPRGIGRTMGVCCPLCEPGKRTREATARQGRPLMTLTQYENLYPHWREVQFRREQVAAAGRTPPSPEDVARLNRLLADVRAAEARRKAA